MSSDFVATLEYDPSFEQSMIDALEKTEQTLTTDAPEVVDASTAEPAAKKRKREIEPYAGTEADFDLAWCKLKSLFNTHAAIFTKYDGEFTAKMVTLELLFKDAFYEKLSPKQKQMIVEKAAAAEKKLERLQAKAAEGEETKSEDGDKKTSKGAKKAKKPVVQTLPPELYEQAWKAMAFMSNPLLSSVEYNFLANLGIRLREYKQKAVLAAYEQDLLVKMLESVPTREALEKVVA